MRLTRNTTADKNKAWYEANRDLYKEMSLGVQKNVRRIENRATTGQGIAPSQQGLFHSVRQGTPRRPRSEEQVPKVMRYSAHRHYLSREKYEEIYPQLLAGPCDTPAARWSAATLTTATTRWFFRVFSVTLAIEESELEGRSSGVNQADRPSRVRAGENPVGS